ncbi:MAG: Capsular polysaccharide biosynthesis protein [Microgenomates group bacterium Gr01-1014_7]|nr:MAG: Capsular polysaccharide biosynthesis protein [Microgenomates group bacterium Gr01-1014_7]
MKKIFNFIKHPLFSGSAIMVLGSNSINLLNYIYHLVIGRMLGPAFYGELAALISLMGLLGIIPGSLSLVIIKYVSGAKNEREVAILIHWLKTKVFKISLIFFIFIIVISPALASFLHINKLSYLFLIALASLFAIQTLLNRSILQGLLKFKEMMLSVFLENGAKLLVSVALVYLGFRVGGAMLAFVIAALLGWLFTNHYLKIQTKEESNFSLNLKPMLLFTIQILVQSLAVTSLYSSDLILVKHFFSSHDAGLYASLSTLGKIIFFGAGPIGSVMFPIVSQRHAKGLRYKKIFLYSFFATAAISLSILIVYLLFPRFAVNLLYGSAYLESANLLVWFGIFMTLFTFSSLLINFHLSLNRTKVVVLPLLAAIAQIAAIWFYHQSLFDVILVSIIVTALLLVSLLIYSTYGNKFNISNSSRLQARGGDS